MFPTIVNLLLRIDGGGLSDGRLLERFLTERDGPAFEALVRRHGPMVLNVCRRVTGHTQDAEDAYQATFLVLARKASSVWPREQVGNWLYGVAYRTALKAKANAARRRSRETIVAEVPEPMIPEHNGDEIGFVLYEELARLPEIYRAAVVLCDLEGRPRKDVAEQLSIPEGTLSSRLTAGRKKLAARLVRRGVAVSAAMIGSVLTAATATATPVPDGLLAATVRDGLAFASGSTLTTTAGPAVELARQMLRAGSWSRLTVVAAVATVIVASGLTAVAFVPGDPPPAQPTPPAVVEPGAKPLSGMLLTAAFRGTFEANEWLVTEVDVEKRTVAVADVPEGRDANQISLIVNPAGVFPTGFSLAGLPLEPNAAVTLDGRPMALKDLRPGSRVKVRLAADKLAIVAIEATMPKPPVFLRNLTAIDLDRRTVDVEIKDSKIVLKAVPLAADVEIDRVFGTPSGVLHFEKGSLENLKPGSIVSLDLRVTASGGLEVRRIRTPK